ncbi:MAG TPA: sigma factor-like helix-turn-helix DNA-binding protein [Candidatus Omnitrophota bacterium]|nr:sigma factor-like helix-turn-helix DNA-binding protein [Candidatus Omnitrophota bacterium]
MEKNAKEDVSGAHPAKEEQESLVWFEKGRRSRNADYHRIEHNPYQEELTPFELEVKENLASAPSPADELARIEAEDELAAEERSRDSRLRHLAQKAKFTPMQRACYQLVYVDRISEEQVQQKLGINQNSLWYLKKRVEAAILKAHKAEMQILALSRKRKLASHSLTPYQKSIIELHEKQGLSFAEIAKRLGVSKSTLTNIYARVQKNIF